VKKIILILASLLVLVLVLVWVFGRVPASKAAQKVSTFVPSSKAVQKVSTADSPCISDSSSSSSYEAKLCIGAPASQAVLTGNSSITATVDVTGSNPGIQHVAFYLNGAMLLEDFTAPYTFTLPVNQWVDGNYTLSAEALLRNQYTTKRASISLIFKSGTTQPPENTRQFRPTSGKPSAPGQPFVVGVAGDGAGGDPTEADVVKLISSWNPNLFLYLGDVYESGTTAEMFNWYGSSEFFGRFKAITDPTVGNHEYLTGNDSAYEYYWDNVPDYYSFNTAGWHFISLNSNSPRMPVSATSAEYKWLQADLAADSSKCTAVFYHQPYLSIGKEGGRPALVDLWKLMAQYHVTLILNGHDHEYQRWVPLNGDGQPSPTGITQLVTGSGGHSITPFVSSDSRVAVKYSDGKATYGAMRLVLNPASADFSFITFAGSVIDSGTIACQGK